MTQLIVPCFRYHGQALCAPLTLVGAPDGGEPRVWCPIRQRPFQLNPEEQVRQALIWFLKTGGKRATVLAQYLRIGVEERSLDLAGFYCADALAPQFCPSVTVIVVETKRLERDLTEADEQQLKSYMVRDRCRSGLLFNGRRALWLTLVGDFRHPEWLNEPLTDLREVEERIERDSIAADEYVATCRTVFIDATSGNFDSLIRLISLFGGEASLTFVLSVRVRGKLTSFQAFSLKIERPDLVTYWARGVASRLRQKLLRSEFHALIAVRSI